MEKKQLDALKVLALKVRSNFEKLSSLDCVNRIHKLTGRSVVESIKGYQILRDNSLIDDEFIREGVEYEKKIMKVIDNPNILELISRLDLHFEGIKIGPEVKGEPILSTMDSGPKDFGTSRKEMIASLAGLNKPNEHVGQGVLGMDTAKAEEFSPLSVVGKLGLALDF